MRRGSRRSRRTRRSTAGSCAARWPTPWSVAGSSTGRSPEVAVTRLEERRRQALRQLQEVGVLMQAGHYDYGNGYHGSAYLNPHQLFLHPSTIWRLAQDLLDVLPGELLGRTEVVAGPATGGA